jgi:hypothetical protein
MKSPMPAESMGLLTAGGRSRFVQATARPRARLMRLWIGSIFDSDTGENAAGATGSGAGAGADVARRTG